MQLVTREQLFKLAGTSRLSEAEQSDFEYNEFKFLWNKANQDVTNLYPDKNKNALLYKTYASIYNWLTTKKSIKFAGKGSARIAFALVGGKCVKIASCSKGIAQNKQEIKNYKKSADTNLKCFTQIYDYDEPSHASILTECCAEAKEDDFEKLYGLLPGCITNILTVLIDEEQYDDEKYKNINVLIKDVLKDIDNGILDIGRYTSETMTFLENCLKNKKPQWNIMRDLLNFYKSDPANVSELLTGDLKSTTNWGLAIREGALVLVILDYGFSKTVYDEFY